VLSLIVHTRRGYRPNNALLVPSESGVWRPLPVLSKAQALKGLVLYRFTHSMYYANAQLFSEEITHLVNNSEPPLQWFCIDATGIDDIDYTAAETLRAVYELLKEKNICLVFAHVLESVHEENHNEFRQLLGKEAFYDSLHDVLKAYQQQTNIKPG
jgi:MFS superfamily sulfate permease-like transporter